MPGDAKWGVQDALIARSPRAIGFQGLPRRLLRLLCRPPHLHQQILHHILAAQQVEPADALIGQMWAVAGLRGMEACACFGVLSSDGRGDGFPGRTAAAASAAVSYNAAAAHGSTSPHRTWPMGSSSAGAPSIFCSELATGMVPPAAAAQRAAQGWGAVCRHSGVDVKMRWAGRTWRAVNAYQLAQRPPPAAPAGSRLAAQRHAQGWPPRL